MIALLVLVAWVGLGVGLYAIATATDRSQDRHWAAETDTPIFDELLAEYRHVPLYDALAARVAAPDLTDEALAEFVAGER